jgi:hypothetical protein
MLYHTDEGGMRGSDEKLWMEAVVDVPAGDATAKAE